MIKRTLNIMNDKTFGQVRNQKIKNSLLDVVK